jgi:hypothetical protein
MAPAPAAAQRRPRRAPTLRALALLAAATLLAAALLLAALLAPAPAAVDVGAPGDAFHLANFYRAEGAPGDSFRWSAPGARLLLPAAADGPLALELRLRGPSFAAPAAPTRIVRDGADVAAFAPGPGPRVYRLLLPPDAVPEPAPLRLEPLGLAAPPAYAPGDPRPLGVALDRFAVRPLPAAGPPAAALRRAAEVAAGLALAWAGLALAGALPPSPRLGAALVAGVGAGLALWAWRDPLGFAWAVPGLRPGAVAAWLALALGLRWAPRVVLAARRRAWLVLLGGLAAGWALLAVPGAGALGAVILLLLPGALTALALFPDEDDPATIVFLCLCGAVAVGALLMLAVHGLPGAPPAGLAALAASALSVAALLLGARAEARVEAPAEPPAPPAAGGWARRLIALALLVAAALRLWHLGGAEFQGDEARAMLLAAAAAQGDDGALLTHTKGPVEALLPAAPLTMAGLAPEWAARLPFALASLGVLAGALALLRAFGTGQNAECRMRNAECCSRGACLAPALLAVALLAVDGFAVGFGRIVQYQSVVMLMMTGALWCCWRFYAGAERPGRHLVAAAALTAVGVLAHYDAAMVAPALAWLVVAGGLRRGWRGAAWARRLAAPVAVGLALLAAFFVPYVLGPSFAGTAEYLAGRAGEGDAGGPPFNNLPLYLDILAFYNAPPLVPLLAGGVIAAVAALLARHVRPRPLGAALACALGLAALVQWLAPGVYGLPGGGSWAALAFGLPLLGLCAAPGAPAAVRAPAIWFATALCANAFVLAEPRTHFYAAHVPAALLVGLAVAPPWPGRLAALRPGLVAVAAAVALAGGGLYAQLVFLRQFPEYQRAFPAARPEWLRARYGDTLPEAGYFGFPHRDGWKAAAELYRRGELRGAYATNQNRWLSAWYTRDAAAQCSGSPELYLIAEGEPTVAYPPGYALVAEVYAGPARAMAIYGREAPPGGPRAYQLEDLAAAFDARPVAPFPARALLTERPPPCP